MPRPEQPFVCHICNVIFGSGRALANHLQDCHLPNEPLVPYILTDGDKRLLVSFRIKTDE